MIHVSGVGNVTVFVEVEATTVDRKGSSSRVRGREGRRKQATVLPQLKTFRNS